MSRKHNHKDGKRIYCPTCYGTGEVALESGEVVPCWNCSKGQAIIPDPVALAEQCAARLFETYPSNGEVLDQAA